MMIRYLLIATILASAPARAASLPIFSDQKSALMGCNGGGVVWYDPVSNQYVYKGSPYYGKGKGGVYVCEIDALNNGAKAHQGK